MPRTKLIDVVLFIVIYIGLSTFPINLFTTNSYVYYGLEILFMTGLLILIIIYTRKHDSLNPPVRPFNWKYLLLLTPCLVVTISNFLYAWIMNEPVSPIFDYIDYLKIVFIGLVVVVEELIFRKYLLGNLEHKNVLIRILISSSVFALCHLTHFFASFNPASLVIVAYSFGLGIILGFIYEYSHSLIACIVFHALFNYSNDFLFTAFYGVGNYLWYYLINVFVALAVAIYLALLYLFKLKEKASRTDLN